MNSGTLGFGLRKKSWKFGFFGGWGILGPLDLDLGKKSWKFGFGGVFWDPQIWTL